MLRGQKALRSLSRAVPEYAILPPYQELLESSDHIQKTTSEMLFFAFFPPQDTDLD